MGRVKINKKENISGKSKRKHEKGLFGAGQNEKRETCWRWGEVMREIYSAVRENEYA